MSDLIKNFVESAKNAGLYITQVQMRKVGDSNKKGEVLGQWSRFGEAYPRFEVYSVSKSFSAAGVGIAINEGLFTLDSKIMEHFPEESYDIVSENAAKLTVRECLQMRSGLAEAYLWKDGFERKEVRDWVRHFFTYGKFDKKPGSEFLYNNANPFILGALIRKKTGQNLRDFMRYRFFEPLGIGNVEWTSTPLGETTAANSLHLNVDELANYGEMILNKGVFRGKRLLNEDYVKQMVTSYSNTEEFVPDSNPLVKFGYGYQIWLDTINDVYIFWGIFGQYCLMFPRKNIVIAIQSMEPSDGGASGDYHPSPLRSLIWRELVAKV